MRGKAERHFHGLWIWQGRFFGFTAPAPLSRRNSKHQRSRPNRVGRLRSRKMKTKLNGPEVHQRLQDAEAMGSLIADHFENNFCDFARKACAVLEPNHKLTWSWHLDYLCEMLTLVKGRQFLRLIINAPPRTLKSPLITIVFPVWLWINEPQHRFMAASYSLALSAEHSLLRRNLLQSAWFRKLWGDRFQMSEDCNQIGNFMNDHGGQMIATSVGGTVMGRGCDTAILDDPLNADQALSNAERSKANNWIYSTLRTRLNDPASGAIILVMQRLHELDPTGFLLEQEPDIWTLVRVPLVAEEDGRWFFLISPRVVHRRCGEILQPERFKPNIVDQLRVNRLVFASQYQQRPAPADGNLIKRSEVQYYGGVDPVTGQTDEKLPEKFDLKVISVDCAFKNLPSSDFVAIMVIGVKGRKRFVLNVVNQHLDAAGTEEEIRRQRQLYQAGTALIEDKANGPAIIQRLKVNVPGVIEINPQGGKIGRMQAAAGEWQAGDWFLNRRAPWTEPLIEQLTTFPNSRYDDICDAMSQAASWLLQRSAPTLRIANAFTGEPMNPFVHR